MQVNLNNNYQQKTSFGMIGIPVNNEGKFMERTASVVYDKTMGGMEKRELVKLGRDKSFNLFKYITLPLNCPEETHILNSLKADGFSSIEQVEDAVGRDNIKRQGAYLDLLDTTKTKEKDVSNKFKELFPGIF